MKDTLGTGISILPMLQRAIDAEDGRFFDGESHNDGVELSSSQTLVPRPIRPLPRSGPSGSPQRSPSQAVASAPPEDPTPPSSNAAASEPASEPPTSKPVVSTPPEDLTSPSKAARSEPPAYQQGVSEASRNKARSKARRAAHRKLGANARVPAVNYRLRHTPALRSAGPSVIPADLNAAQLPAASGRWVGKRLRPSRATPWTLAECKAAGFRVFPWNGRDPHAIVDKDDRGIVFLVGHPNDDSWPQVASAAEEAITQARLRGEEKKLFKSDQLSHRRGRFFALASGVSHGGGQTRPGNLVHSTKVRALLDEVLGDPSVQRIAGFQSSAFAYYAPKIYRDYASNLEALYVHDPQLQINFPHSIFPAITINFGPETVTLDHTDPANVAYGMCLLTSGGNYDPTKGGHLILFDLGLVIEFPPGATIMLPSSILRHGNCPIQGGERRISISQYCAGGLFRWVKYGFQTSDSLEARKGGKDLKRKLEGDDEGRTKEALNLFSKVSELSSTLGATMDDDPSRLTPPPQPIQVPLTRYHALPSGNLGWSTHYSSIHASPGKRVRSSSPSFEPHAWEDTPAAHHSVDVTDSAPWLDPAYAEHLDATMVAPRPRRATDNPLKCWIPDRDSFVAEDMRWDGRGEYTEELCPMCGLHEAKIRCEDCEGGQLLCSGCTVAGHRQNSLHRVKAWNKTFFEKITLKDLGLRIQLGHRVGEGCSNPKVAYGDDFVVVHVNGVHEVAVDFCNCETAQLSFVQLLRHRWYPATVSQPKSAATFAVLKHFHLLTFESKASCFEFYHALTRLSDNTGIPKIKDRYSAFMRMVREYRHIKMLKRSGRGHDPAGAAGTAAGELAVLCPACPQPGLNLPSGWQNEPPEKRWIYRLFLGIDANFRLKRKHVSNSIVDPALGDGMSYFVKRDEFINFLNTFGTLVIQDPSTCSNHKAVDAERSAKGLAATGVGTIDCARHDVKRPQSVGDLQRSERLSHLSPSESPSESIELVVSYDIACQWSIHIWKRMEKYPRRLHLDAEGRQHIVFLVPKFHLPAHIMACQTVFSFNYNWGVGRTDGEAPERGWSHINPVATSTREMGPGSRQDTLDDHFGDWNWKKTTLMGVSLLRKIQNAVAERSEQVFRYHQLEQGLDEAGEGEVRAWKIELEEWLQDHTLTLDAVRRELAVQDAKDLAHGNAYILHETVSASQFMTMGLDLEEHQRRLGIDAGELTSHSTDYQNTRIQVRRNVLRRKIDAWIEIQHLYMPALSLHRSKNTSDQDEMPEKIPLMLPSSLKRQLPCDVRLQEMEWRLRKSQANDALDELREGLRLQAYLYIDKDRFQRGQHHNTRSRNIIDRVKVKIKAASLKYRVVRVALGHLAGILSGTSSWEVSFPVLAEADISQLSGDGSQSEGHRSVSWIWSRLGDGSQLANNQGMKDALRIEFCKSKARADRWSEEVQLLLEEMRRVLQFFESMAVKWDRRPAAMCFVSKDSASVEALRAYAARQASQYRRMRGHCQHIWRFVPEYVALGLDVEDVIPPELNGHDDGE
ncbi:hypothetical protein D9615_006268 [Tricholomella constricta]|uniref:CxC2-like cysteine cluster KDZ transposase-associated domain-containing protein n=1 Tax=Tricholomella constricta TaxID=117010 RepID=A0A8H5M476_9AGAR|nr:hypothetical protein D9615_006268 [Tricholomella constricta]